MYFDVAYVLMTLRDQTVKFQDMDKSLLDLLLSKFKKGGNDTFLEASLASHVEKARSQHNSLYNLLIVNPAIIGTSRFFQKINLFNFCLANLFLKKSICYFLYQ